MYSYHYCHVAAFNLSVPNCVRDQFSMRNAVTSQLVRHYLPRFATVISQQPLEKPLSSCTVPSSLQKYIDYFTILVNCPPQIALLSADLHEDFIDEKCTAESLVPTLQTPGILRSKLITPQPNSFITDGDSTFSQQIFDISMTEVKSIIEPHTY